MANQLIKAKSGRKTKIGRELTMNDQTFTLLMARFDTLEEQNRMQLELMDKHVEKDDAVHSVVERHSAYWKLVLVGLPMVGGYLASKIGWK
jgi:hypothetical protein